MLHSKKTKLVALMAALAVVLAVACGGGSGSSPTTTPTPSPTPRPTEAPTASPGSSVRDSFDSVYFVDDQKGWVAGTLSGKGVILATADGGKTWARQYTGSGSVSDLQFVSPSAGWAEEAAGDAMILLHTTDGGKTWVPISHISQPISLDFITPTLGRAVFEPEYEGALMETADGGKTWTAVPTSTKLRSICFGDANDGWAVGWADGDVLRTSDGGRTWTASLVPPKDPNLVNGTLGFWCNGPDIAWANLGGPAGGGQHKYALYRTLDGGAHWTPVMSNYPQLNVAEREWGGSVQIIDAGTAFVVGGMPIDRVSLQTTRDGGRSWGPPLSIPGLNWPSISFVDADHGWAVGRTDPSVDFQAVILATSDGGQTWTEQYP